jgi:hypothetical protein
MSENLKEDLGDLKDISSKGFEEIDDDEELYLRRDENFPFIS